MKKRIYLPLLSLILVFSLFSLVPAARVFVKELYDRSFGFAKKAVSSNNSQSENTGSADASGPRWILVDTSYTVVEDKHYGYYDVVHSFEGDSDGTVRFKRSGGYFQDGDNYFSSDIYYECMKPPASLTPGQSITMTLKTTVKNYEHASSTGAKPGVHADTSWVQDAGLFKHVGDENNPYLVVPAPGDTNVTGEFTGNARIWNVIGSHYEIMYCISNIGTYTWRYELQNVAEKVSSDEEDQTSADASGPIWVLVDTSHTVVEDKHYGYYDVVHSFEGDSDGTVRFKRSGGYFQDGDNYFSSDIYYECMKPPASLIPGQSITMTLKTTVKNYEHASSTGAKPGVHADTSWVQDAGLFKHVGDENNPYLVVPTPGDTNVTGEFTGNARIWNVIGSHYEIMYCISNIGTYTWRYELQNVSEKVSSDEEDQSSADASEMVSSDDEDRSSADASEMVSSDDEDQSSAGVSGPRWVLVDTSHTLADDRHNEYYDVTYSFEEDSDGTVRFTRSGGYYQDARNYFRSDDYYECMKPPASLTPGQSITMTLKTTVKNYEHASSNGTKAGVHADTAWVQDSSHFKDVLDDNNTYLVVPVTGDTTVTGEFAGTVSTWNVIGSHYEIKFCISNTGTYTWTYELQNVSEKVSSDEDDQSSAGASGPRWVLVDTSHTLADDRHNEYYDVTYSFEEDSDGTVRFTRSGGYYQDARNYFRSDDYYECMKPPASLTPGQSITMTLKTTVKNYEHASSNGTKAGVHADTAWVQDSSHFKDVLDDNNTYLVVPVTGDTTVTGEFAGTVSTWNVIGSHYEIKFCISNTGTYTWTYELQDN